MNDKVYLSSGHEDVKCTPITKQEMIKACSEYYEDNKKNKDFNKSKIPLTEFQKKYLSNFCQNIQYVMKSGSGKKDFGYYTAHVPLIQDQEDEVLKEIFNIIEKNTYPYDSPIFNSWCVWYGEGAFLGLHMDPFDSTDEKTIFNTSILVHQSEDLEGGEVIVAGDIPDNASDAYTYRKAAMTRLKVIRHDDIGSAVHWHPGTVHGVGDIRQGERITLMVLKKEK